MVERKVARRHLIFYLRVFDNDTHKLLGYVGDISTTGIMLVSEDPIPTNKSFTLSIRLNPRIDEKEPQYLTFQARSIWCRNDINPSFFDTGFELLEISKKDIDAISDLISNIGFND